MAIVIPGKDYTPAWNALADVFGNYAKSKEIAHQRKRQEEDDARRIAYHQEQMRNAKLLGDKRAFDLAQAQELAARENAERKKIAAKQLTPGEFAREAVIGYGMDPIPTKPSKFGQYRQRNREGLYDAGEPIRQPSPTMFGYKGPTDYDRYVAKQKMWGSLTPNEALTWKRVEDAISATAKRKQDATAAFHKGQLNEVEYKKLIAQLNRENQALDQARKEAEHEIGKKRDSAKRERILADDAELEQTGAREQQILSNKAIGHYAYPTETVVGPDLQDQMGFVGGRRGITPYESESAYRNFVAGGIGREPGELTDPQEELRKNYLKQSYKQYPVLAKQTWGEPNVADIVSGKVTYTFAPEGKNPVSSANRQEKTLTKLFEGHINAANEAAVEATGTSWEGDDIVAITEAEGNQMINAILMAASQLSKLGYGFADVIASDIMAEPGYYANIIDAIDSDVFSDDPYTDYTPMKASKIVGLYKKRNPKENNQNQTAVVSQGTNIQQKASLPSKEEIDILWEDVQKTHPGKFKSREELVTKILDNIRAEQ